MERVDLTKRARRLITQDDREALRRTQQQITALQKQEHRATTIATAARIGVRARIVQGFPTLAQHFEGIAREKEAKAEQLRRERIETSHNFKQSRRGTRLRQQEWNGQR